MPTHNQNIQAQFTKQADTYANTRQARDEAAIAGLVRLAGVGSDDLALDVACGPGVLTRALAKACRKAVGCDVTEALLEKAIDGASDDRVENIDFKFGDATSLPFQCHAFTVATCRAAFHHFEKPHIALAEMARVTRPGGTLLVADIISSEDPMRAAAHNGIERICDPTHVRALPRSEFEAMFDRLGIDLVSVVPMKMDVSLDAWIEHGGPTPEAEQTIRRTMASWLTEDVADLNVRSGQSGLMFTHNATVFIARISSPGTQSGRSLPPLT